MKLRNLRTFRYLFQFFLGLIAFLLFCDADQFSIARKRKMNRASVFTGQIALNLQKVLRLDCCVVFAYHLSGNLEFIFYCEQILRATFEVPRTGKFIRMMLQLRIIYQLLCI